MNKLDQDIDEMQKIIENRCPSCHQEGRRQEDHDEITCIRYFRLLLDTDIDGFVFCKETRTITDDINWSYICCEEDHLEVRRWLDKYARASDDNNTEELQWS